MDVNSAALAAEWIGAEVIIPMHYNTFPYIRADVNRFKDLIENKGKQCTVMNISEVAHF